MAKWLVRVGRDHQILQLDAVLESRNCEGSPLYLPKKAYLLRSFKFCEIHRRVGLNASKAETLIAYMEIWDSENFMHLIQLVEAIGAYHTISHREHVVSRSEVFSVQKQHFFFQQVMSSLELHMLLSSYFPWIWEILNSEGILTVSFEFRINEELLASLIWTNHLYLRLRLPMHIREERTVEEGS